MQMISRWRHRLRELYRLKRTGRILTLSPRPYLFLQVMNQLRTCTLTMVTIPTLPITSSSSSTTVALPFWCYVVNSVTGIRDLKMFRPRWTKFASWVLKCWTVNYRHSITIVRRIFSKFQFKSTGHRWQVKNWRYLCTEFSIACCIYPDL